MTEPEPPRFSPRELEIVQLMADGLSYSEIAAAIGWTPDSVRVTAHRMAKKLPGSRTPFFKLVRWHFVTKGN